MFSITVRPVYPRGYPKRGEFRDDNEVACSIQESSVANRLWLGREQGNHSEKLCADSCLARMHLTREMAAALIPFLEYFVRYGDLPETSVTVEDDDDQTSVIFNSLTDQRGNEESHES